MDRSQVRARIVEVAQAVKQALMERGFDAEEQEPEYKYNKGVAKARRWPFWSRERGYKYIDDLDEHLSRMYRCLDLLKPQPGSAVFEIGPGSCYFLVLCRELHGCRVAGVDWVEDEAADAKKALRMPYHQLQKDAFRLFREHFGLHEAVRHQVVKAYQPVAFAGKYDAIVALLAMFNRGWREAQYRYWLRDCYEHLQPKGQLMIALNKVHPDALAALPCLRPRHPHGDRKLTILSREAIGQVLNDESKA